MHIKRIHDLRRQDIYDPDIHRCHKTRQPQVSSLHLFKLSSGRNSRGERIASQKRVAQQNKEPQIKIYCLVKTSWTNLATYSSLSRARDLRVPTTMQEKDIYTHTNLWIHSEHPIIQYKASYKFTFYSANPISASKDIRGNEMLKSYRQRS